MRWWTASSRGFRTKPTGNVDSDYNSDDDDDDHNHDDNDNDDDDDNDEDNDNDDDDDNLYIIGRFCLFVMKNDHFAQQFQIKFFSSNNFFF